MTTQATTTRQNITLRLLRTPGGWAALVTWGFSVWATMSFCDTLGVAEESLLGVAIVTQIILTTLETQVWAGRATPWHWWAFIVDLFINMGGIWPWTKMVWSTPVGFMINDFTTGATGYTLQGVTLNVGVAINFGWLFAFLVTGIIGSLMAFAPEGIARYAR
jgi:hypothetical protein